MRDLSRGAVLISLFTGLASLVSLAVDIVVAGAFGAGAAMDAFLVASLVPNILLASAPSVLSLVVIPVFHRTLARDGEAAAWGAAGLILATVALLLALLVGALVPFAPRLIALTAPGLSPRAAAEAARLLRWLLLGAFLMSLTALVSGLHNAAHRFLLPAMAPVLQNAGVLAGIVVLAPTLGIVAWPIAITASAGLQLALLAPLLLLRARRLPRKLPGGLPETLRLLAWMLATAIVYQSLGFADRYLASFMPTGSLSYLGYGNRVGISAVTLIAGGIGTVTFLKLSAQAARDDTSGFARSLVKSMCALTLGIVPVLALVLVLREPILTLLFQRRAFTPDAVEMSAAAMLAYAGFFFCMAVGRPLPLAFYALRDGRTPFLINLGMLLLYVPLAAALAGGAWFGFRGLAVASSLVHLLSLPAYVLLLQRRLPDLPWREWLSYLVKIGTASLAAAAACVAARAALDAGLPGLGPLPRSVALLAVGVVAWSVQMAALWASRDPVLRETAGRLLGSSAS